VKAGELLRLFQSGVTDLRDHLVAICAADFARAESERAAAEELRQQAERGTLSALCDLYVGTLEGRASFGDVKRQLALHVTEAFPALAQQQAATIRAEQFRDVLARLIEAGKGRTAAKVRAYLRAAYALAMRAGLDASVPGALATFKIETNPLERLPALSQYSRALDRALTLPELLTFWRRLQAFTAGAPRDAVSAALLLGGQRPAQLLRVTSGDIDLSAGTIMLLDIKGRNRAADPRRHVLPIVAELAPIIERRRGLCADPKSPLFSTSGRLPLREETAAQVVTVICAAMAEAGELDRGPFALRDLRRTAETQLAAMGVSSDVRAQIQSHGLGGIQQRHYDRHDYMAEKRAALELWANRLHCRAAKVTPIKSKRSGAA
jgi:integrase